MNFKHLVDEQARAPRAQARPVETLSNDAYRELCKQELDARVRDLAQRYRESARDAWKYVVRMR
jgi:hypothetical protein